MTSSIDFFWQARLKASGIHFGISLTIALMAALLVFVVWYPYPYREISGGRELFFIVVTVDVILGPLITLTVFNRAKPWRVMRRDLAVVALIQLAALGYGLWTVFVARPVHMVFENDRFSVVHAIDVSPDLLPKTPHNIDALPLMGPTLLSLRPFKDSSEKLDLTLAALNGLALSARPDLWQSYGPAKNDVLRAAKPVTALKSRLPAQAAMIDAVTAATGKRPESLVYVPLVGRKVFWTVFLDPVTADILAFAPIDSF